jgi:hypothetical protein
MKEACNALLADNWQGWLDILIPYYDKTYAHSEMVRTGEKYTLHLTGTDAMDAQSLIALKNNIWKQA